MKKRLLAILLTVCMVLSMAPAALAADSVFTDVKADDWYADEIKWVYDEGLMDGVGGDSFAPETTTTRAMLVTILWRLEGKPAPAGANPFTDVPAGEWYTEAVVWAAENKIVEGYGANLFGPTDELTREQMVTILYRYANYKEYDVETEGDLSAYTDADQVADWAQVAMLWAIENGLINGVTDTTLAPQGDAIRGQLAAILYRLNENVIEPAEKEEEPVTPPAPPAPPVIIPTPTPTPPAEITAISVNSSTHKTAYKVGDTLDVTDLTILVDMSYGSDPTVEVTAGMVTGFNSSAVAASQTLTIAYEGKTTTYTISIAKADGPAAPDGLSGTSGKITGTTTAMEYSATTDFASATDCADAETTGMVDGTYYVRYKETATHEAGEYATVIVSPAEVTAITVNSSTHKVAYKVGDTLDVTNLTILVDMSYGSDPTVEVTAGMVTGFDSSAVVAEQTLTITYEGKTITYTISIAKADGPEAPAGLAGVEPTFNGDADGKITGTTAVMEYSTTTNFDSATDCDENETTGFEAGTYYVRVKATATHNAGAYATVVVPEQNLYFKLVGGSTPETATKLADVIGNYADGATIVLTSSYYDLSLPAGTDVPKNLTIIGGGNNATPVVKCDIKANIDGLTLQNIWFMAGGGITGNASAEASQSIKNMTVDTCYFEGGDTALQLGSATCENMTIKDCVFTGNTQSNAIRLYNVSGETKIIGNTINSAGKYGISLLGDVSGTVTIDDNTIKENNKADHNDDGNGGLRIQNVLENSTVAITNNDLTNACTEAGQVLKVSSTGTGASVTFDGNTYGGEAWNPENIGAGETNAVRMIPVKLVGGSTPATATKLVDHLAKYTDGTTIVLTSSYYDLSLPAGTDVPKNLTIIGGGKDATPVVRCEIKASVDGLTLQNIWFMAGGGISGYASAENDQTLKNMTVDTCYFEGGDTALILGANVCENMTIKNCEFTDNVQSNAIRLYNVSGETKVIDNEIYSAGNYGVALLGTVSGIVTVDNNVIEENDKAGGDNAGLRIQDVQANTTVTISNNKLTNACKADGQVIKVSSTAASNSSVVFSGNKYDNDNWNPENIGAGETNAVRKIPVKLVGGSTPETATKLADVIGNYADGATIVLTSSYYDLSLPAGTDVPKNLTIIGGGNNATPVVKCDIKANIDGLTLQNIWFMAGGGITGNASAEASQSIKNMTVDTCFFEGGDTALQLGSATCENMTIKNCVFTDNTQSNAIRLYNVSGTTTITGNEIYSAGKYGISLLGDISGTVTIDDNTIEENNKADHNDDGNGGLRIQNVLENSTVVITNNDLTNACTEAGQVLKVSSTGTGASVTFAGNTYGGEAWNPENIGAGETNAVRMIPVKLVGGSTPETATKLVDHLAKYVDGTTIVLSSSYYDLSLPAGTEVPKNLTIIGGGNNATPVVKCDIKANIDGLTLKNIWFMAGGGITGNASADASQSIKNMTVDTCYFEGVDVALQLGSAVCESMTIKNCEFTGNVQSNAIRLYNVSGETKITGNKIYSAGKYGIALLGTVSGTVTVDGNIVKDNNKADDDNGGLRIDQVQANATVSLSNNELTNASKDNGQVLKVTSTGVNASVALTNNTWNGYDDDKLSVANGVWTLPVVIADGLILVHGNTYEVYNATGLSALHTELTGKTNLNQFGNKTIEICDDINAEDVTWSTLTVSADSHTNNGFTFNGNRHTISNLTINGTGLFSMNANGTDASCEPTYIKDITFENVTVNGESNYHVGVIWSQMYGDIVLDNVHVKNSNIVGGCNVGGLIGRNGDEGHSTIVFNNCSVTGTVITANSSTQDPNGASAFLGSALKTTATCTVTFEGTNTQSGNTMTSADGQAGGGVYATWNAVSNETSSVNDFVNYTNA